MAEVGTRPGCMGRIEGCKAEPWMGVGWIGMIDWIGCPTDTMVGGPPPGADGIITALWRPVIESM